jgi:outer membrane protein assembly factor BamB
MMNGHLIACAQPGKRFAYGVRLVFPWILAGFLSGCASWFSPSAPKPEALQAFTPLATVAVEWQATLGSKAKTGVLVPAISGDAVFAASAEGRVMRLENGQVGWQTELGESLSAGVGANGDLVAVVTARGHLIGLDAREGQIRFSVPVKAEVLATPALTSQIAVLASTDGRLMGFSTQDGELRWTVSRSAPPLVLRQFSSLLVDGDIVVAGHAGGRLAAVDARQGQALWTLALAHPKGATELERLTDVAGAPVLAGTLLCAASYQGRIGCFDARNGRLRWSSPFSSTVGVDHDGERLFSVDAQNRVSAFDLQDGQQLWQVSGFAHRGLSRPLAVDANIVFGDIEGYLHVLDAEKGERIAQIRLDDTEIKAPPLRLGSGRVLVQTQGGGIYALAIRHSGSN